VLGEIRTLADLPEGVGDRQEPGRYELVRRRDRALFGCATGMQSWKKLLYPPELRLLEGRRAGGAWRFAAGHPPPPNYAFLGVRACDAAAIAVQDKVFAQGTWADPYYRAARERAVVIVVQCTSPGGNCFCASMGAGPRAGPGFDLALTERATARGSDFLVEVGGPRGAQLLRAAAPRSAPRRRALRDAARVERCARGMPKSLETDGLVEALCANLEHPRWRDAARRCLACANCTLVCPTCFCCDFREGGDLAGERAERRRSWDSCFTGDFSYIHGGSIRPDTRAKYRQWCTHKLATWHGQFGCSGCVGCGRCITWCPVGIDITEEAAAVRGGPGGAA
ncbi:MAG: 4Fe-4S dicluster domain-containing protein, partial [Elusimicrobia bacterium]|nr:4Fe-4S dicluster domain-containing protein [Elusimicrobiota bacterium]